MHNRRVWRPPPSSSWGLHMKACFSAVVRVIVALAIVPSLAAQDSSSQPGAAKRAIAEKDLFLWDGSTNGWWACPIRSTKYDRKRQERNQPTTSVGGDARLVSLP